VVRLGREPRLVLRSGACASPNRETGFLRTVAKGSHRSGGAPRQSPSAGCGFIPRPRGLSRRHGFLDLNGWDVADKRQACRQR